MCGVLCRVQVVVQHAVQCGLGFPHQVQGDQGLCFLPHEVMHAIAATRGFLDEVVHEEVVEQLLRRCQFHVGECRSDVRVDLRAGVQTKPPEHELRVGGEVMVGKIER